MAEEGSKSCRYTHFNGLGQVAALTTLNHRPSIATTDDTKDRILSVNRDPYHLSPDTKPSSDLAGCSTATLVNSSVETLVENCIWSGTVASERVLISGPREVPQPSSAQICGAVTGFVKCNNGRLIGTFNIGDSLRYITVEVKPSNLSFECSNAILAYDTIEQLLGDCKWTGNVGKDELDMDFGGNVSIAGPLVTIRPSSIRIHGAGTWNTVEGIPPSPSVETINEPQGNPTTNQFPNLGAIRDPFKLLRERQLLESGIPIIAIFGQSGTGKSTLINQIALEKQMVGKGLQSCTSDISILEAKVAGQRVVVIDTPGIDDTRTGMKEADILIDIATRLAAMGEHRVWVTGVLYLHRISDNKFSQTADRISNMLKNLCGDNAMHHLMLCTTMWDTVPEEEGYERFDELCETDAWRTMISGGAGTAMISNVSPNAKQEAEKIVSELLKNARPVELAIQDEMINQRMTVGETGAGQVLSSYIRKTQEEAEHKMRALREAMRKENAEAEERLMKAMRVQELELDELKKLVRVNGRDLQSQAEPLTQGQEKAEQIEPLHRRTSMASEAGAARMRERMNALGRGVDDSIQQGKGMFRNLRSQSEPLTDEQQKSKAEIRKLCRSASGRSKTTATTAQEDIHARKREIEQAIRAQEHEMKELERQAKALATPHRSFFWWLNPYHLILAGIHAFLAAKSHGRVEPEMGIERKGETAQDSA